MPDSEENVSEIRVPPPGYEDREHRQRGHEGRGEGSTKAELSMERDSSVDTRVETREDEDEDDKKGNMGMGRAL
jgi:hypothetical protein